MLLPIFSLPTLILLQTPSPFSLLCCFYLATVHSALHLQGEGHELMKRLRWSTAQSLEEGQRCVEVVDGLADVWKVVT